MQRGIFYCLDFETVELTADQIRVELQRPEPERRRRGEVAALEVRPRLGRVDRGDVEQQVHAAFELGQPFVDL